jgi:hypothetical protein
VTSFFRQWKNRKAKREAGEAIGREDRRSRVSRFGGSAAGRFSHVRRRRRLASPCPGSVSPAVSEGGRGAASATDTDPGREIFLLMITPILLPLAAWPSKNQSTTRPTTTPCRHFIMVVP